MEALLKIIIESNVSTDEKIAAIKEIMQVRKFSDVLPVLPSFPRKEDWFPLTDPWFWPYDRKLYDGDTIFSTTKCQC